MSRLSHSDLGKIRELNDILANTPEYIRISKINSLSIFRNFFNANANELIKKIEWGKIPANYYTMWMVGNRPYLYSFQFEVTRLLQNYISSAKALVSHTRRFYSENYKDTGEFNDYEEQTKKRFSQNHIIQFVHCLRNYYEHYSPTFIVLSMSHLESEHKIFLEKEKLLLWKKWNKAAKEHLKSCDEEIEILNLIVEYQKLINQFFEWMHYRLYQIHTNDIKSFNNIQLQIEKIVSIEYPKKILGTIKLIKEGRGEPEDIFGEIILPNRFNEILESKNWQQRQKKLIDEIQHARKLPLNIVQEINNIFADWYINKEG